MTPRKGESREAFNARRRVIRQSVQYDAGGRVKGQSVIYVPEREPHTPLPNSVLARRSTLVDAEGNVIAAWHVEKPEDADRRRAMEEWGRAFAANLPRVEPIPAPVEATGDLMACYPIGDHHMGMLAWKHEVGSSYDLDIAERLLAGATDHLVAVTPACERAAVVFLGDFMHYDSFDAVTPTNRNILDSDGRFPKLVDAAVRAMRRVIEVAAARHKHVQVIVEIGNHDLASSIWLMALLTALYENNPRVTIDRSPSHYHYFAFGKCLIGTHHGHGAKLQDLPLIMAHDRPGLWGAAEHRYWWTGHVHQQRLFDYRGCTVESFRVLPPTDAWAHNGGWRAKRDMKAIILHADHGEVARHTVNPAMLEKVA